MCVLLPHIALVEVETNVVVPQINAVLYHLSNEVRAVVYIIYYNWVAWCVVFGH